MVSSYLRGESMRLLQNRLLMSVLAAIVVAFAFFVWPTPYRYDRIVSKDGESFPVRTNRLTGNAERLSPNTGWIPMQPIARPPLEKRKILTAPEIARLEITQCKGDILPTQITCYLYNGTRYTITDVTLRLVIKGGDKVVDRLYDEPVNIPWGLSPNQVTSVDLDLGFELTSWEKKLGPETRFEIHEARGFKEGAN